jgi:hypothetical protein
MDVKTFLETCPIGKETQLECEAEPKEGNLVSSGAPSLNRSNTTFSGEWVIVCPRLNLFCSECGGSRNFNPVQSYPFRLTCINLGKGPRIIYSEGFKLSDLEGQKSLTSKYNKYLKYILEYDFQFSNIFMQEINEITKIRNCIAHANGNLETLSDSKRNEIEKIASAGRGVSVNQDKLDITFDYLNLITNIVFKEIERLMTFVEEKST